jgi:cation diffusion facilitator family transporter
MRKRESSYKLNALKISTAAITSVALVEVVLGFFIGSLAILSDGVHALLDATSMIILLITTKASLKPPDREHMYGHEKIEPIGGLIGGIILFGTALLIFVEAIRRLLQNENRLILGLEFAGFAAIAYTFCMDILRVKMLHKAEQESVTVKAGFYHALADLGSTFIAFLGFGLATIGFYIWDSLASMVLSGTIGYLSVKLVWSSGMELSDIAPKEIAEHVRTEILGTEGVCGCENLRIRKAGAKTFVEATVKVPDYMNLEEAHATATKVEEILKKSLKNAEVTLHIEPPETEMQTERLIEKLAREVEGVKGVHAITTVYAGGKLYVTLHAKVAPSLSIGESHQIAEKVEKKIREKLTSVENVTVHIEPFSEKTQKGSEVDEAEIRRIVKKNLEGFQHVLECKRIITYVAGKTRYINIDCSFTSKISIKDAHNLASRIERSIKKQLSETMVTVHMEPCQK